MAERHDILAGLDDVRRMVLSLGSSADCSRDDWIGRETAILARCAECGLPKIGADAVAGAWQEGCGMHHRYVPEGLTMPQLLDACGASGVKICNKTIPSGGEHLPTERGVFEADLGRTMTPTNRQHHPFMLDYDAHIAWAKAQGGDGIASAEQVLYSLLRDSVENDGISFMGGWIRCSNACGSGFSLGVDWDAVGGLQVAGFDRSDASWCFGAVPRKFRSIGV